VYGPSELTEQETVKVLARLRDSNLLIVETAIATGARISEILGLQWRHIDLKGGILHIVQRNWRGDIDDPKSKTSKRPLTLGYLVDRYRTKATADKAQPDKWVFARTDGSALPLWDSGVRQSLKRAAVAEGCDFPGLGPHSFRRANITWRQEVGGSSIEASKIVGHSTVRMTEEYTKIQLTRQEELTRLIQERLASVGEKQPAAVQYCPPADNYPNREQPGAKARLVWESRSPGGVQIVKTALRGVHRRPNRFTLTLVFLVFLPVSD